ncbi:hypothetical protein J0H33_00765 [bacterium]|jgi:hypothetical protein|nr:hypothetical protein [bacterium]
MGFYYSSGNEPPEDDKPGFLETLQIIWVVFRVLAVPLGMIIGVLLGLVLLFWLFTVNTFFGLGFIAIIILALVARGVWEARHPPDLP